LSFVFVNCCLTWIFGSCSPPTSLIDKRSFDCLMIISMSFVLVLKIYCLLCGTHTTFVNTTYHMVCCLANLNCISLLHIVIYCWLFYVLDWSFFITRETVFLRILVPNNSNSLLSLKGQKTPSTKKRWHFSTFMCFS